VLQLLYSTRKARSFPGTLCFHSCSQSLLSILLFPYQREGDSVTFPYRAELTEKKKIKNWSAVFSPISWERDVQQHKTDMQVSELTHNVHKFTVKENHSSALAQLQIMSNKNKLLQHILPCSPKIVLLPQCHGSCLFLFNLAAYNSGSAPCFFLVCSDRAGLQPRETLITIT